MTGRRNGTTSRAQWLDERGYGSTLDYLRAVAIRVIEETGLLPHLNPGVMSYEELARLKHVSASMGMMLETSSDRLTERGGPHFGSPDKVPAVRLRTIEDAGRLAIPFTTGILVGIGETARERAESLFAIRDLHRRYRHVQEVIVQNFRAKPGTAMRHAPEPEDEEFLAAVATARIVLGPHMSVQAPPNLSDPAQQLRLLDAGINDWGGVSPLTPDHVNPEKPWPTLAALTATTAERGFVLRERLTIYGRFAARPDPYLASKMRAPVAALLGADGLAVEGQVPEPDRVAGPGRPVEAADDRPDSSPRRPTRALREDAMSVYGDFDALDVTRDWSKRDVHARASRDGDQGRAHEGGLPPRDHRRGRARAVPRRGPGARRALPRGRRPARGGRRRRGHLRHQPEHQLHQRLLRRVPLLRVRAAGGRRRVVHAHARPGGRSGRGGLGGGGDRGVHAGRASTPTCPGTFYFDLLDAIRARTPGMHIHAFSPMEVLNGATKLDISFQEFLQECRAHGLGTIPGTAAEILDDDVRWLLTKGKLPGRHVGGDRPHRTRPGHPQQLDHHVRPRRRPAALGRAHPAPRAGSRTTPAASRSSCRCRSSTRTPRSTWRARRARERRSRRTSGCTRWRASCSTD